MKPTSLVTGGAGFVGSWVAKELLKLGHRVVVIDDLSGGFESNVPEGAIFIEGDINPIYQSVEGKCTHVWCNTLEETFSKYKPDYVFHLAAYAAEGLSHHIRGFNYTNNVVGSMNVINQCILHKVKRLVFTSSIAVYGHQTPPFTEEMTPTPADPYGVAKYAVEMDLKAAKDYFGLDYTIFRPFNVYGPNQHLGDPYRNVVGIFLNQLMQGKPLTIFGDGSQVRAFSYIEDIAPTIANSINIPEAAGETFNIGGLNPYTVSQLAVAASLAMGVVPCIEYLPFRKEVHSAYSDRSKLERVFGEIPSTDLQTGLEKMIKWAKDKGPMTGSKFGNIEIPNNLPPSWAKLL